MRRFAICIAFLSLNSLKAAHEQNENCPNGKKHYRTTIRHIESGGIGYDNGYTTLEIFLASDPNQWKVTPFLDAKGHVFNNGKWAANAGTGLRALWGTRVYGINTYYDFRNTSRLYSNQIGIGLETLGELFDFRINGYLPVGAKTSAPYDLVFETFSNNYMMISQKIHSAMKGANAEFGFHLGNFKTCNFYIAAGPYYFIGNHAPTTWGAKARVSGTFKEILTLEISDSYDRTFHNKFQGQLSLNFSFGPKSKIKNQNHSCKVANTLNNRMLQPVDRQEIIVIDKVKKNNPAINPATGLPYFFVFVDNTSSSNGTYESPYHSLIGAQDNSSPNDIIYVFPGDGTTSGMDSGIALKTNQKLWGSGISHSIQTSQGTVSIPAQSSTYPKITNTNVDTEGNAVTLAAHNAISGLTFTSALNDAIYGVDTQSLDVSFCIFENIATYPIEAAFPSNASVSLRDNQFFNNANGIALTLNDVSVISCSNNQFEGQTSVSSAPLEIIATGGTLTTQIENNLFNNNTTGSVRFSLDTLANAEISLLNNTITNNDTGFQSSLASSFVIIPNGTTNNCSIVLRDNLFHANTSNAVYFHTSGAFTTLGITLSANTISNNQGSGLVLGTPVNTLTVLATDNTITESNDNGVAIIASGTTTTGTITINNNTIENIGNASSGIAINQDFSTLNLTILNNEINGCEGSGIISYSPNGISNLAMTISENTISHCENGSSNAASGLDIEQYTNVSGSITDNTFSENTGLAVIIGSTLPAPNACLTLSGNTSTTDYLLSDPGDGIFNLTPCNVHAINIGTINTSGTINLVQTCPDGAPCPP